MQIVLAPNTLPLAKEKQFYVLTMWEICVCARPSERERVVVCVNFE